MPVRTTMLRLERAVREEHQRALALARLEWQRLAQAVVQAARRRGFAGDDPYLALQALAAVDHELRRLASALGDLWLGLIARHGADARAEEPAFRAAADAINRRLAQAHGDGPVDAALLAEAVAAIVALWAQLPAAPAAAPEADDLAARLEHERAGRQAAERERDGTVQAFGVFLAALSAALAGRPSELPGRGAEVVAAVRALADERAALVRQLGELRQRLAQLAGERRQLADEMQELSAQLERLRGARQRRFRIAAREARALQLAGERRLADVARQLRVLHARLPLSDDPARLRSAAALGADPATLEGQVVAWREAAADILAYADRWRWALGVQQLSEAAPRLAALFAELTRLIAAWRGRLGLPSALLAPTATAGADALCALPPLVAEEVRDLAARAEAAPALPELVRVLEPSVACLARALAEARGRPLLRPPPPREEAPVLAARRLADELWELAGTIEACFAEVVATDFRLPPGELALLDERARLTALVQEAVAAAQEYGRTLGEEPPLPPPPPDAGPDAVLAAARAVARWFDVLAVTPLAVEG